MARDKSANPQADTVLPKHAHEGRDVDFRLIVFCVVLVAIVAFAVHSSLWWWLVSLGGPKQGNGITSWTVIAPRVPGPERNFPVLQLHPEADLRQFMEREHRIMNSYGWAGSNHQFVRIPVEQAMQMIVKEGLPSWKPSPSPVSRIRRLEEQRRAAEAAGDATNSFRPRFKSHQP